MANFLTAEQSHQHSLETLEILNQYQDFMDGIKTVADMGCGTGLDSKWFAELVDINGLNRNIQVTAIDSVLEKSALARHPNIQYIQTDYTASELEFGSQDFVWAHDSFQLAISPFHTLSHWWQIMKTDAMLAITVPSNFYVLNHRDRQTVDIEYTNGAYFNWSLGNLIISLATCGFDCRAGHFKIDRQRGWIHAAVYRTDSPPNIQTNWYNLLDSDRLPLTIHQSLMRNGTFKESDLVVDWIDRSQYIASL